MNLRKLYYFLPTSLRHTLRRIIYWPGDAWRSLRGQRSKYEPPRGLIYTGRGAGSFIAQGKHQFHLLNKYLDLRPEDKVLDVGSGIGRTAIPLTEYLSTQGAYEGFDVVQIGVDWCTKKITPDFPNFKFTYVPLKNDLYNDHTSSALEFTFPYPNHQFDRVFLFSVFTHMGIEEIDHYLKEISRVLKPGGQCLATFFVYDRQSESQIAAQEDFNFPVKGEGYRLMDKQVTAANIAVDKGYLSKMIETAKLRFIWHVEGAWKRKEQPSADNDFQDVVLLQKPM